MFTQFIPCDPAFEVMKVYRFPIVAVKNSISSHILLNYQM